LSVLGCFGELAPTVVVIEPVRFSVVDDKDVGPAITIIVNNYGGERLSLRVDPRNCGDVFKECTEIAIETRSATCEVLRCARST
jgi:hypothetical protein